MRKPGWLEFAFAKRFSLIFLVSLALLSGVTILIHYTGTAYRRSGFKSDEAHNVEMRKEAIAATFRLAVSDLMYLSEQNELYGLLEDGKGNHLSALTQELVSFSSKKRTYDQIRFLDETGMEIVRVNFSDGAAIPILEHELQYKGDRYYFSAAFKLARGEVYVSPFDLNIEYGEVELPQKPVIRFGTPVFDRDGRKRGVVLLNLLGAELIRQFKNIRANPQAQVMLLNRDGFWLSGCKIRSRMTQSIRFKMTHSRGHDTIPRLTYILNGYAGEEGDVSASGTKLHQVLVEERDAADQDRSADRTYPKDRPAGVEGTHRQETGEETNGIQN